MVLDTVDDSALDILPGALPNEKEEVLRCLTAIVGHAAISSLYNMDRSLRIPNIFRIGLVEVSST